jgi:hypothetical protein
MANAISAIAKDGKVSADELIAKHLQSLGKSTDPGGATRLFQGKVVFSEIIGRNVHIEGTSSLLSQGRKIKCTFQFGMPQYQGEQFVFDGQKGMVGMIDPTSRSNLGAFLYSQEEVLREGLFGGTLSSSWPLLDLAQSAAKLKYDGLRKIDGGDLHDVSYTPKKRGGNGDLSIHLYFDPENYHHVMTIYTLTLHNPDGNAEEGTDEVRQTLEERFDDFRVTDGLTVPWHWTLRFHVTPQTKPQEFQWESKFENFRILN